MSRGISLLFVFAVAALVINRPTTGSVIRDKVNINNNESEISLAKTAVELKENLLSELIDNVSNNESSSMYESSTQLIRIKRDLLSSGRKNKCPHGHIYEGNVYKTCITCKMYREFDRRGRSKKYRKWCHSTKH